MDNNTEAKVPSEMMNPAIDPLVDRLYKEPVITEDNKEDFFRAFMTDEAYEEEVPLFGGKAKVKFTTMTVEQNNDILRQIAIDQELNLAKNQDEYFIKLMSRRLGLMLVELNGVPFAPEVTKEAFPLDPKTGDSYLVRKSTKVTEKWHSFKLSAIIEAFRTFEKKVENLTKETLNENFWKAAA